MMSVLLILNTCVAVALVILILLQKTDPSAGGMFGGAGGSTQTVVRNPLAKPTAILAGAFIVLTLTMAYVNKGGKHGTDSIMTEAAAAPAAPSGDIAGMAPLTAAALNVSATVPATAEVSVSVPDADAGVSVTEVKP